MFFVHIESASGVRRLKSNSYLSLFSLFVFISYDQQWSKEAMHFQHIAPSTVLYCILCIYNCKFLCRSHVRSDILHQINITYCISSNFSTRCIASLNTSWTSFILFTATSAVFTPSSDAAEISSLVAER